MKHDYALYCLIPRTGRWLLIADNHIAPSWDHAVAGFDLNFPLIMRHRMWFIVRSS